MCIFGVRLNCMADVLLSEIIFCFYMLSDDIHEDFNK